MAVTQRGNPMNLSSSTPIRSQGYRKIKNSYKEKQELKHKQVVLAHMLKSIQDMIEKEGEYTIFRLLSGHTSRATVNNLLVTLRKSYTQTCCVSQLVDA